MSKIVNEYVKGDEIVEAVRSAIEFRATWMGLIFDEMRKAGVDAEGITRRAIARCGHLDGKKIKAAADGKEVDGNDICKFSFRDLMRRCFQMDPVTSDENNADAWLHYCPLITAWQKLGFDDETIALLCDITMDGDRNVAAECGFGLQLDYTIGGGDGKCNIHFKR